jgi:hypothetical protein
MNLKFFIFSLYEKSKCKLRIGNIVATIHQQV